MSFLTAEWNNLAMINYEVDPAILEKYVPKGTELDFYNGKCYVSFIGFLFENVRLLGMKIPFHTHFEEVNLRFYVRHLDNGVWKRGAVFISEIVPKLAITLVANTFYNEEYRTMPMKHEIKIKDDSRTFIYQWKLNNTWNTIYVETQKNPIAIEPNSEAEFITEHYFGYSKINDEETYEYEVTHPRWQQYEVIQNNSIIDFEAVYGKEFSFIKEVQPTSVFLAVGSKITIEGKRKI
ncbi:MAG: YqjF family protein [Kaistella sp.]